MTLPNMARPSNIPKDPSPKNTTDDEEEDDYMNFVIPSSPKTRETPLQRRQRLKLEAEKRARPKPKAEREADERAATAAALSASLFTNPEEAAKSKGLAMMAKMGFKPGAALGKEGDGRAEPIGIEVKEGKGGIGLDTERKRIWREEIERGVKRVKRDEGDYRERVREEREAARLEGMVGAAMRALEQMEADEEVEVQEKTAAGKKRTISARPLKSYNVLLRGLIRKREEKERDRRMRHDLQTSLSSRLPSYDDATQDVDDERALGKEATQYMLFEDLDEEDLELDEFNALSPAERLEKLTKYLREGHRYCFYCKFTYPDVGMEGCPGLTEEDHD